LRSTDGIGVGWHVPSYPGPYGKRGVYQAALQIELPLDELYVEHHTKELFRYQAGQATVEMLLDDDAIVALIQAPAGTTLAARATYRRQLGASGDWDFGLLARQDADGAGHLAAYAEGTAFALLSDRAPA